MSKVKQHYFVCTNARPPFAQPSCGPEAGNQLLVRLREEVEKRNLANDIKITSCGCLGPCENGPVIVVYPEATWYGKVQPEDLSEIVESHMIGDKPVERLLFEEEQRT